MSVTLARVSASATAAVNAANNLVVLGSNTAAGPFIAPGGTNAVVGGWFTYCSDGTTVGADVGVVKLIMSTAGTQWFLAGGVGGQNATGDATNCPAGAWVTMNLPLTAGENISAQGFESITDLGAQGFGATLVFGQSQGPRTWHDVRVGQATAVNTPVSGSVRADETGLGGFVLSAGMKKIYGVSLCAVSTSSAVGQWTAAVELGGGNSIEGGNHSFVAGAGGGTLNTSMTTTVPYTTYPQGAAILGAGTASVQVSFAQVDPGAVTIGIGLHISA